MFSALVAVLTHIYAHAHGGGQLGESQGLEACMWRGPQIIVGEQSHKYTNTVGTTDCSAFGKLGAEPIY